MTEGYSQLFIDDASTDKSVISLINDYCITPIVKLQNRGIKDSLLFGYEHLFKNHDLIINLDSDAIVAPNCFAELIRLKTKYPDRIITGFHSTTKNKDGSERHIILEEWEDVYVKKSVGGINMIVNRQDYEKYVRPQLLSNGNHDHKLCLAAEADGKPVLCVKKSLVQHIGYVSSLHHSDDVPDTADDFKQLSLPNITLIGADTRDPHSLKKAALISQKDIEFGAVKLFGPEISIAPMYSKTDYSLFILRELYKYIDTEFVLIIQADGFVINSSAWEDEFLRYDICGATWSYRDNKNNCQGGFSLRSKKLLEITAKDTNIKPVRHPHNDVLEDHLLGRVYRDYLIKEYGIKFPPDEVCNRFSIEALGANVFPEGNKYNGQFGFHSYNIDFSDWSGYKPYDIKKNRWKVINYNGI